MATSKKTAQATKKLRKQKLEWRDITSYLRGEEQGVTPARTWELGQTRIIVTRQSGCSGWYLRAHRDGVDLHQLKSADIEAAKAEAIVVVRHIRTARLAELKSL